MPLTSQVVVKTVIAVQPDVAHSYARCRPAADAHPFSCFELLGLDLLGEILSVAPARRPSC